MDKLGRYYTRNLFSELLVSQIAVEDPCTVLELGVGDGALLKSAINRWLNASYIVTDIDSCSIQSIASALPFVNIHHVDSLESELHDRIKITVDSIDVAICNPPYLRLKSAKPYHKLFESVGLSLCKDLNFVTSDVVFLAQNLGLLKKSGQLGIILPDSIIAGKEFIYLRENLLQNHQVSKIIQLPENIFPKTEALTHILFIEKGSSSNEAVQLFDANALGHCGHPIVVKSDDLVERMDFKYHAHLNKPSRLISANALESLGCIKVEIKRGTIENKVLKAKRISQEHTTSMIHAERCMVFGKKLGKVNFKKYVVARPGDILLARVGRGCIGKVSMVGKGNAVISDCIYRIRVSKKHRERLFEALISESGQQWLKAIAHGVCAKVLSKFDLLKFPMEKN